MNTLRKQITSPARINSEMSNDINVREVTDCSKISPNISSFLSENSNSLPRNRPPSNEMMRQLSQITKTGGNYEELSPCESGKTEFSEIAKSDYKYDCDTSSQYSSELLNTDFMPTLPAQNHSKSLSYETDNTEMSLPKFSAEISVTSQTEIPRFHMENRPKSEMSRPTSSRSEGYYRPYRFIGDRTDFPHHHTLPHYNNDESSKIYIIDASTPSPKSKRYLETSFDNLEFFHQPTRKIVEVEVHKQQDDLRRKIPDLNEALAEKVKEVKERRKPIKTIDLQGACALPPPSDYYYQAQITKMAIKGIF